MNNKVYEIKNFLSKEECENITKSILKTYPLDYCKTDYIDKNNSEITDIISDFNKRKVVFFPAEFIPEITKKISNKINEIIQINNIKYDEIEIYTFNEYLEGDFLEWHNDMSEINHSNATITILLMLNDNFDGGDFLYELNGKIQTFEKKCGNLYIFDSYIFHKVNMVTKGVRYSLNGWPKQIKINKNSLI